LRPVPRCHAHPDKNLLARSSAHLPWPPPCGSLLKVPIHGLRDQALLAGALNDTWELIEKDLTLVTIPEAGHFVQQDASELVSKTMKWWLTR
jgi:pimeloyl-ACP methyl ester carboxylesterase